MSPIHTAMMNALQRQRTCAKCGRVTVVPPGMTRETVKCKHCGADLPPKRER